MYDDIDKITYVFSKIKTLILKQLTFYDFFNLLK